MIGIVQGWLDILAIGHVATNTKQAIADVTLNTKQKLHCHLDSDDILQLLAEMSHYL